MAAVSQKPALIRFAQVRILDAFIERVLLEAMGRSTTLVRLITTLDDSDAIVHIDAGRSVTGPDDAHRA
jgi:hypothetical protein